MGLGYSSTTPKLLSGLVFNKRIGNRAGCQRFGLASVYAAPLSSSLLSSMGMSKTFMILGIAFMVIILVLVQFVSNPPDNYIPEGTHSANIKKGTR